ncbi:hypothetical protein NDU88_002151 [Pleurodeles waltl]|uniref:Uncharacterized protein n=3 Tax=Pleurodeles waltl TaxID=8319 RepID=A0AAV7SAS8_PLEWA|nr:hypothetical protein NDU88_002151 [Pleurodeles waltl]
MINPELAWDIQREHDAGTPKELSGTGHRKKRLGETRERSASPKKSDRSKREEAVKKGHLEAFNRTLEGGRSTSDVKRDENHVQKDSGVGNHMYAGDKEARSRRSRSPEAHIGETFCTKEDVKASQACEKKAPAEQSRSDAASATRMHSSNSLGSRGSALVEEKKESKVKGSELPSEGRPHFSYTSRTINTTRKATVSPGPWKIPGSDKLPNVLKAGTSALSR